MLVIHQKHLQEIQKKKNQKVLIVNQIIVDGTVFLLWTLSETQIDAKTAKISENLEVHYSWAPLSPGLISFDPWIPDPGKVLL